MGASRRFPSSAAKTSKPAPCWVKIDNPETLAKNEQALAAKVVAEAQLANINAGTRAEVIAARRQQWSGQKRAWSLAQKTYDRTSQLAASGNAPQARLDQMTDALHESQRAWIRQNRLTSRRSNGYTREEHEIAEANVAKPLPTSRRFNRSSTRWWSTRRSSRRYITATSNPANSYPPACRW